MIKAFIVEDELPAQMRLKQLLAIHDQEITLLGSANTGAAAITQIEQLKPELLFLDIQLPDKTGFEVLSELSYQPLIIFTTAYAEYALKAFENYSIDYLVKPISADRFQTAIRKLKTIKSTPVATTYSQLEALFNQIKPKSELSSLPIKKRDRIILVDVEEVAYLKAEDKYVMVALVDGTTHLLNKTITQLEKELPERFIRVHRSYIVNERFIAEIQKHFKGKLVLKLKDKQETAITTGETYSFNVKKRLRI